jgi:acyl-CoA thioesterase FadM
LRLFWIYIGAHFRSKLVMSDPIELQLRVLPNDLDLNRHMNNGRFMTVLDLGMVEAVVRSGFMKTIRSLGGHLVAGGALITFRRSLNPFDKYTLRMRYLGTDGQWHVFSFVFLQASGAVSAKGLLKGAGVRKSMGIIPSALLWRQFSERFGVEVTPPELPPHAREWLSLEAKERDRAEASCFDDRPPTPSEVNPMKTALLAPLMAMAISPTWAAHERTLNMDSIVLEDIKVEGLVQAWKFRKVCLDGQAYLLILGASQAPIGISAAFKDGKPEQCKAVDSK